jgi:hypothetical protein
VTSAAVSPVAIRLAEPAAPPIASDGETFGTALAALAQADAADRISAAAIFPARSAYRTTPRVSYNAVVPASPHARQPAPAESGTRGDSDLFFAALGADAPSGNDPGSQPRAGRRAVAITSSAGGMGTLVDLKRHIGCRADE